MFRGNIIAVLVLFSIFALPKNLYASPTSDEFKKCKKLAVIYLQYCLDNNDKDCWKNSEGNYKSCLKKVRRVHLGK